MTTARKRPIMRTPAQAAYAARQAEQQAQALTERITTASTLQAGLLTQRNSLTREYFELGRLLHEFDCGRHWAFVPDPADDQTHGFVGYGSFDKWLKGTPELGTTTCRNALQSWRLWVVELEIPLPMLIQVDLSKYIEINPIAQRLHEDVVQADRTLQRAEQHVNTGWGNESPEVREAGLERIAATQAQIHEQARATAIEWVNKAMQLSRTKLRAERAAAEGWVVETVVVTYDELPDKLKPYFSAESEIYLTGKQVRLLSEQGATHASRE